VLEREIATRDFVIGSRGAREAAREGPGKPDAGLGRPDGGLRRERDPRRAQWSRSFWEGPEYP
jgi:hypothetical protein